MQSFVGAIRRGVRAKAKVSDLNPFSACSGSYSGSVSDVSRLGSSSTDTAVFGNGFQRSIGSLRLLSFSAPSMAAEINSSSQVSGRRIPPISLLHNKFGANAPKCVVPLSSIPQRWMTTSANPEEETQSQVSSSSDLPVTPRIKFKRLDKTAGHIMKILDKEAVESVRAQREIPDIKPGYIIQMRVEFPENKRRVSTVKGIVIARRNAGLNTTFRLRRLVAGVGVESLFPLYSPNIKEIKVIDKKKVRRAKLYYLREKMNPLKK